MNSRFLALIAAFMVQIIYGFTFTFANDVIDGGYVRPYGFILLRTLIATLLFWILACFTTQQKIDKKDFKTFFYASFFGMVLNMLTFFKGLEYTTPIHASVIMTVVPIIVLVMSSIYLSERITKFRVIGIIAGFSGALILSLYGKSSQQGDDILFGNALVFVNAVSYAVYLIIIKKLTNKYHPFTFIKWLFLFGTIMTIPFGLNEAMAIDYSAFNGYTYFSIAFVIVGATFGTYLLNPLAMTKLKASTIGTFLYLQPFVAGVFAIFMGSDSLDGVKIIAALLIFSGVFLVSLKAKPVN